MAYVAQQVKVPAEEWAAYDCQGRAITRHRAEIRTVFGFRASTEEDQERLALHLLQSALVHVNTLLMQEVLADPKWADRLTDADRRAPSPPFWTHVNPSGRFELDMNSRLDPDLSIRATVPGPRIPQGEAAATPA